MRGKDLHKQGRVYPQIFMPILLGFNNSFTDWANTARGVQLWFYIFLIYTFKKDPFVYKFGGEKRINKTKIC